MAQQDPDELKISDFESTAGSAEELPPHDRARLSIAHKVLAVLAIIFIAASLFLIFGPMDRLAQEQAVFDFVKTIVPPIATVVIGFYFRSESQ